MVALRELMLSRPLNNLDRLVTEFVRSIEGFVNRYVIVAGYVAILFGRPRTTDDVDMIVEAPNALTIYNAAKAGGFELLTSFIDMEYDYRFRAIRFYKPPSPLPNLKVKAPRTEYHVYALDNRVKVRLGNHEIYISPIELQIAYKLYLGSIKDLEDAKYLYELFIDKIDRGELEKWARKLGVDTSILET